MPAAVIAIVASTAAEAVGAAVASTILGATVSSATAVAIGSGVIAAGTTLATGGDVSDALENAVTAGVGSVIGGVVSGVVSNAVSTGAPEIITNAVSSAAGSAARAAATGGDVGNAALIGALGGAGATAGRDIATAGALETDPFSQQTAMLKAQEQGLGTAGGTGAQAGGALGAIAGGADPSQAILSAIAASQAEQRAATPTAGESGVVVPGAENVAAMVAAPGGEVFAGPAGLTVRTVEAMPQMQPRANEVASDVIAQPYDEVDERTGKRVTGTSYKREVTGTLPSGKEYFYTINYDPENPSRPITYEYSYQTDGRTSIVDSQTRPEFSDEGVVSGVKPTDIVSTEGAATAPAEFPTFVAEPFDATAAILAGMAPQRGTFGGVSGPISDVTGAEISPTAPLDTTAETAGLTAPPSTQEISIPDQFGQVFPTTVTGGGGFVGELAEAGLGTEAGAGEEGGVALGEGEGAISPEESELALEEEEPVIGQAVSEEEFFRSPSVRDTYISGGRRPQRFGPTVRTLGQALAPPLFPSAPVSGLTSYRGAGEIESQKTGKPRRDVWNEASLRLKDALGL